MSEDRSALRLLAEKVGITDGYRDAWGRERETTDATRLALLAAMGVIRSASEAEAALRERETLAWRRALPPVAVVQEDALPYEWTVNCEAAAADRTLSWTLELESGETRSGELRPADLPHAGEGTVGAVRFRRAVFRWHERLPTGYHRFRLEADAGGDTQSMSLVVTPARCYLAPGFDDDTRVWGAALQLYAVRSGRNWGIGDFTDLRHAIEATSHEGAAIVGVNPLHALFPHNPGHISPYSPSSRAALNPLYIDVEAIPGLDAGTRERIGEPRFQARLRVLRGAERVDYAAVAEAKLGVLRALYQAFREKELGAGTPRGDAFARFLADGGEPLLSFALYHALQASFHARDESVWGWPVWPESYRDPAAPAVREFLEAQRDSVEFHAWLQWIADEQLAACGQRSMELGLAVGLYLDLAVSVDRAGAEAWAGQALYAVDASIGAPPDAFNLHGQNWGLPPLVPERLAEAAYAPFIAMLRANMKHAGALRIDHVMGLMRLYWVPPGATPEEGAYVRYPFLDLMGIVALESQRNRCMVIGEDLGTLPDGLQDALRAARVLSYRLLLFERAAGGGFLPPADYPVEALAAVGTHDLPTLRGFWLGHDLDLRARLNLYPSDAQRAQQVVERAQDRARLLVALEREGLLPEGVSIQPVLVPEMTPALALAVHAYLARGPSRILMLQLEDVFGQIEQVNLPATGHEHANWQRKLALNLEEWAVDGRVKAFAAMLRNERGAGGRAGEAARRAPVPGAEPVVPRATYRLQFNREFTFAQATALVPYLADLGVSHVYCSPYLKARPGSLHGYDIIDHGALNPEIGSEADFDRFVAALKTRGMGQILDFVPNHMGVMGADNDYWLDVLENGPASEHAEVFDIDWNPAKEGVEHQVVVPALAQPYGAVLERGELRLAFDAGRGEFGVWYFEHRFPVNPRQYARILGRDPERLAARLGAGHPDVVELKSLATAFGNLPAHHDPRPEKRAERRRDKEVHKRRLASLAARSPDVACFLEEAVREINGIPGEPPSFAELHALLETQAYRLAYWRVSSSEINYRRFFDINDLAALRMENPGVFEFTHRLVLRLLAEGKVDGLRIDHPDGLYDPLQYFRRLQARRAQLPPDVNDAAPLRPTYVVVEKILGPEERLPAEWPVHGTTGYDFLNLLNGLFLDSAGGTRLERFYRVFTREPLSFEETLYRGKRLIMRTALAGELNVLATALARIAEADRHTRDFTRDLLRYALREIVACFPVYRTYIAAGRVREEDRCAVDAAVQAAKRRATAGDLAVFDFVRDAMLTGIAHGRSEDCRLEVEAFAMKLQQYTAPVTAKGMEDTAFYQYNRLISLNEVGGDPARFGTTLTTFHRVNRERQKAWPHAMLATSTHDNKRSEDVRARLNVLSELPEEWRANVTRWGRLNRASKRRVGGVSVPGLNDEYFIYQTLLGAWPLRPPDERGFDALRARVGAATLKSVREAKAHSSWLNPNAEYEEATAGFIDALLRPGADNAFLGEFLPFQRKVARIGLMNSVSQAVLKLTVPGVPDLYQGNESWNLSLVDPDNRRPVDYALRARWLAEMQRAAEPGLPALRSYAETLLTQADDGRLKLYVTWRLLQCRSRLELLFREGDYTPLRARGPRANNVCAFSRAHGAARVVVIAPRWFARLMTGGSAPVGATAWEDTMLDAPHGSWTNVLTGEAVAAAAPLRLADTLATLPWAVLIPTA